MGVTHDQPHLLTGRNQKNVFRGERGPWPPNFGPQLFSTDLKRGRGFLAPPNISSRKDISPIRDIRIGDDRERATKKRVVTCHTATATATVTATGTAMVTKTAKVTAGGSGDGGSNRDGDGEGQRQGRRRRRRWRQQQQSNNNQLNATAKETVATATGMATATETALAQPLGCTACMCRWGTRQAGIVPRITSPSVPHPAASVP